MFESGYGIRETAPPTNKIETTQAGLTGMTLWVDEVVQC